MEIYFGIPSYKRCGKVRTLDTLLRYGVDASKIVISTQTMEDYEQYTKEYGHICKVIYADGCNASCNRNTLIENIGNHRMVLLDDDIKSIEILSGDRLVDIGDGFIKFLEYAFTVAVKNNVGLFGIYPVHNPFFMKNNVKLNTFITGPLFGIVNTNLRFNTSMFVKEDIELSLSVISSGKNVLRFNNIAASCGPDSSKSKTSTGCGEHWVHNEKCVSMLLKRYGDYIKLHPSRPGEVSMRR